MYATTHHCDKDASTRNPEPVYDGEELYEDDEELAGNDLSYDEGDEEQYDGEWHNDDNMQEENDEGRGDYDTPSTPQTSFFKGAQAFSINGGNFSAIGGSYYLGHVPHQRDPPSGDIQSTGPEVVSGHRFAPQFATASSHQLPPRPPLDWQPPKSVRRPKPSFFEGVDNADITGGTFSALEGSYYNYGYADKERAPPAYGAPSRSRYVDYDDIGPEWRRSSKASNTSSLGTESLQSDQHPFSPPSDIEDLHDHRRRRRPISRFKNASNFRINSGNFLTVGGNCYGLSQPPTRPRPAAPYVRQPSQPQQSRSSVAEDTLNTSNIPRFGPRKSSPLHTVVSPRSEQSATRLPSRSPRSVRMTDTNASSSPQESRQRDSNMGMDVDSSFRGSVPASYNGADVSTCRAGLGSPSLSYKRSKSSARHSQT